MAYQPKKDSKAQQIMEYLQKIDGHKATKEAISIACQIDCKNIAPTLYAAEGHEWVKFEGLGAMATVELIGPGLNWNADVLSAADVLKKIADEASEETLALAQLQAAKGKPNRPQGVDYAEVLSDLRHKQELISQAIAGIEAMVGLAV